MGAGISADYHPECAIFSVFINDRLIMGSNQSWASLPFTSETQALLTKVMPSRTGSYEKHQKGGRARLPTVARRLFGETR